VDQFHAVERSGGYPEAGGRLRWRSSPAGRGTVEERVLEHEPRRLHRIAWSDPQSEGELETSFAVEPGESDPATRLTQVLDYRLRRTGPLTWLTDHLFVRGQMARSMQRSLVQFRREIEEISEAGRER
jgi:hypothetical protein